MRARTALLALALALALALVVGGCGGDETQPTASAPSTSASRADESGTPAEGLSPAQRRRADQLISIFENSTTELRYEYAENLGDGRGVTAGRAGFTTATCDALAVIELYTEGVEDSGLARFRPELERLCEDESDDTSRLPEDEYMAAWAEAAADPAFRRAQDAIVDREYFSPAMEAAAELGLARALARAQLYDAAVQHGAGDDPDGLAAMIRRTTDKVGPPADVGEEEWLDAFFEVRLATLRDPANQETTEAWRESTDRVECFRAIAEEENYDLDGPISCTVYGDEFTVA